MKLKEYLEKNCLKRTFITKHLGVTKQMVSKWMTGGVIPRKKNMDAIYKLTNGHVNIIDWFT